MKEIRDDVSMVFEGPNYMLHGCIKRKAVDKSEQLDPPYDLRTPTKTEINKTTLIIKQYKILKIEASKINFNANWNNFFTIKEILINPTFMYKNKKKLFFHVIFCLVQH